MTFRPSVHGWPFAAGPGVEPHMLGLGAPPAGELGLGGGLCWAALDRYRRGVRIARDTPAPEPGEPLHAELVRRQLDALSGVWPRVRDWQGRPDGSWRDRLPIRVAGGRDVASLSRAEWPSIRRRLDRGEPVLLTLLGRTDPYRQGHAAWQVLATGWRLENARTLVSIYDPARPDDDDVHLAFGPGGPFDGRTTGGRQVRGFFAVPYDRAVPRPVRAETFGDRSVIGLNRKVLGRVAPVAGRACVDLVARDADGALLHFRRERGRSWEGANITERDELGGVELHSDPVAVRSGSGLHVFARSYVGDLLHFEDGRTWTLENRTEHKRAGPRFRITGAPVAVAGPWRRVNVFGLDKDGGLVHYWGQPVVGWRAEQVAGDPLRGDPLAAWVGDTLHVVGFSEAGGIRHWTWDDSVWSPMNVGRPGGLAESLRGTGRPALHVTPEDRLHLAVRTAEDQLVVLEWDAESGWAPRELGRTVAGDPVLTAGPAGVHLFARAAEGGLIHAWRPDEWHVEDVLATRTALADLPATEAVAAWGSPDELRVWSRADHDLWTLLWRADADWTADRLTERAGVAERHRPGEDPVVMEDEDGQPHLFFTDGRGTVLHVEPSEWRDPAEGKRPGTSTSSSRATKPAAAASAPKATTPATPPASPAASAPAHTLDKPSKPGEADKADKADATSGAEKVDGAGGAEKVDGADGDEAPMDLPYLDFEADPTPAAGTAAAAAPDAGEPEEPGEPAGGKSKKGSSPADLEPMDLSLLDTWPPPPPSLRKKEEQEQEDPEDDAEEAEREREEAS